MQLVVLVENRFKVGKSNILRIFLEDNTILKINAMNCYKPTPQKQEEKERNEVNINVCIMLLMEAEYIRIRDPTTQSYAPLEQHRLFLPFYQNPSSLN